MATAREKMNAARILVDAGFKVAAVADLFGQAESTVYGWLEKVPPADRPSVAASLDEQISSREEDSVDRTFVALARATALKLDSMLSPSAAATEAMSLAPVLKEYRGLVNDILGPSKDDEEWLIGVFAKVGHAPDSVS